MVQQSSAPGIKGEQTQMYFFDLRDIVSKADTREEICSGTEGLWRAVYKRMNTTETLWVHAPNDYRDRQLWPVAMAVADFARNESPLVLKNIITVHQRSERGGDMISAYDEILFFVKNKREYQFHKNRIRVEHVYKGNEWGGERKKGNSAYHDTKVRRYNPDGKDPGNVWVNENRTETETQEVDKTEPLPTEEAVRRCVLVGSDEEETVHTLWAGDFENIITGEERTINELSASTLRREVE